MILDLAKVMFIIFLLYCYQCQAELCCLNKILVLDPLSLLEVNQVDPETLLFM